MKYLFISLILLMSFNITRAQTPQFQSTDPKKPWYKPPPSPGWGEAPQPDTFVVKSYEDWIAHPDAQRYDPNMDPAIIDRIHTEMNQRVQAAEKMRATFNANWKSKKALDDVIGTERNKQAKQACVGVVIRHQMFLEVAGKAGHPKQVVDIRTQHALQELVKICPDVPPEKLVKLLKYKPEELCEQSGP